MYLIGEDKFISRLKNEEWKLDNNLISDMISDGVLVASLVSELKELENTHILTYIVDMYLREHKIEKVRDLILKALSNVKVN